MPRETNSSQSAPIHVGYLELSCDTDSQALAAKLVDDKQRPERLAIVGAADDEVIRLTCLGRSGRSRIHEPSLSHRHRVPGLLDPLSVRRPAGSAKQRPYSDGSRSGLLAGKLDDVGSQPLVIGYR